MSKRKGNHLLYSIFLTLMVSLLIPIPAASAQDDFVIVVDFGGDNSVIFRPILESGLIHGALDASDALPLAIEQLELGFSAATNPSLCYNLRFTNPRPTTERLIVSFSLPIIPVTGASLVSASLAVDVMDTDGNTLASITTLTPTDSLQVTNVVVGTSPASLGVDVGMTLNTAGMQQFTAGVPMPLNGPINTTGWNVLVMLVSFFVSGNDTVQLQGMVNMDTGSGAPVCSIPVLPTDPADPGGPTTPTPIPSLPQWAMILLTLSLLTLATWQLAGRPVLVGARASGSMVMRPSRQRWLTSLLVGQGIATLGLVLYAVLVGPLVPHDGVGGFLAGLLLAVMVEGYRRSR